MIYYFIKLINMLTFLVYSFLPNFGKIFIVDNCVLRGNSLDIVQIKSICDLLFIQSSKK